MKRFCMECGLSSNYIGESNKPSSCLHCHVDFDDIPSNKESQASDPKKQKKDSFKIEGTQFKKNFLLDAISISIVDDNGSR